MNLNGSKKTEEQDLNMSILPNIGVIEASDPATYLITPFQNGDQAYLAFLGQATKKVRVMIYGFTLDDVVQQFISQKAAGVDVKLIFDHSQAEEHAERPEIQKLVAGGFKDGVDFLIGTSPKHHAINHLKATWIDDEAVLHGSWNYSVSADAEYNSIEIVRSPELARAFDQVFSFAWRWILQNEAVYNTVPASPLT